MNTNAKGNGQENKENREINNRLCYYQSRYMNTIKSMEIDEEKQQGLYKIECWNKQIKKTYSDHNSTVINIDFISPKDVST